MAIYINAHVRGSFLARMSLEWWQDVKRTVDNIAVGDAVMVLGTVFGRSTYIYFERINATEYLVRTPSSYVDRKSDATVTTTPITVNDDKETVTIACIWFKLQKPAKYRLTFGRRNAPTDDGGEFPPIVYTKSFDTSEQLAQYLDTEVLPVYSGEEGFFYRTEAIL